MRLLQLAQGDAIHRGVVGLHLMRTHRRSSVWWSWGESKHRNLSGVSAWIASARGIRDVCLSSKSVSVWWCAFCAMRCATRRADQEGLADDHPGCLRFESLRPACGVIGSRLFEVRPFEIRVTVRPRVARRRRETPSELVGGMCRRGQFRELAIPVTRKATCASPAHHRMTRSRGS